MLNAEALAGNIRKYREMRRMNQTELARRLFVTPQTVSKWENGQAVPDLQNLCNLAEALDADLDALLARKTSSQVYRTMIGIDGGGTKTDFILFREDGAVLHRLILGGSNPNACGMENACRTLQLGIDQLLAAKSEVVGVFAGLAGISVGDNQSVMEQFFRRQYPRLPITFDTDILNVIHSVRGVEKCAAAICGTGSVVYGCDGKTLRRAGGYGFIFDGAGSGFDIGRDVLSRCMECDDGITPPSLLTRLAEQKLGGTAHARLDRLYDRNLDFVASFAPLAFEASHGGDPAAAEILERNFARLARLIRFVQQVCDCGTEVVVAGGLTRLREDFEHYLGSALDGAKLRIPDMPPVYGACVKCASLYGTPVDDDLFDSTFRQTLTN